MSTLNELLECYKFDELLKYICGDLFGSWFCPQKINVFYKGCMLAGINKTRIGTDRNGSERIVKTRIGNGLTKPGSERIDKTRIGTD
jgi:hypothetical protein